MLYDVGYHNPHVWMNIVFQFDFIACSDFDELAFVLAAENAALSHDDS